MALHNTFELIGRKLDFAVALVTGRAIRPGRRATDAEAETRKAPFEMYEVIQKLGPAPEMKAYFLVRSVAVASYGEAPGAARDRVIRYIDRNGEERTGSVSLFFFDRAEAEMDRQGHAHGFFEDFRPSTYAADVLPLMNSRTVKLARYANRPEHLQCVAEIDEPQNYFVSEGPTLEVAFCRVLVEAALGPEVEVPDDVL